MKRGILVSFEGIDGCGKSTIARLVADHFLQQKKRSVILTKEPGGTELGKVLRATLQEQNTPLDYRAEFLLFAADRAEHMSKIIMPALQENKLVISDRMADSSLVYQGFGLGLDVEMLKIINTWAMQHKEPDLTFYIRVDYETARARCQIRGERLTAFEKRGKEFIERLIQGFDFLAQTVARMRTIDGAAPLEISVQKIVAAIDHYLGEHGNEKRND